MEIILHQIQSDSLAWTTDTAGAYCNNKEIGQHRRELYNWYAINDTDNIAPAGCMYGDDEWKLLEQNLGMSQADAGRTEWRGTDEGEKLKIAAPEGWTKYGTVWATNESGLLLLLKDVVYLRVIGDPGIQYTGFW